MRLARLILLTTVVMGFFGVAGLSSANKDKSLKADLDGFQEVPTRSTTGTGEFRGKISQDESSIEYELTYSNLEGTVLAAHIHLGASGTNGGVLAFLCGGGGKPPCPGPSSGTVSGTIVAGDIIGSPGQGIAAGELDEVLTALRAGVVYANVHSTLAPGGEIRGQVK